MRSFLPLAALLGVALVLGCQDVGTGPDGVVPQFARKCDSPPCPKDSDGGVKTNFVAAITNVDFSGTLTTETVPVDNKFNTGNSIDMDLVVVDALSSDGTRTPVNLTFAAFSVRKRQGKLVSAKVWVGAGGTDKFATDYLLLPAGPATILDEGFTLHVHAELAEFVRLHDTSGTVAFTLNIGDIVYTPAP